MGSDMAVYGDWASLSWTEAAEALAALPIVLLPIGAIEPHGPHLPLDTDVRLSKAVAKRAAKALAGRGWGAWVLPAISYGLNDFGSPFSGNITVSASTLAALISDVCRSLVNPGVSSEALKDAGAGASTPLQGRPSAVVLVNSHLEYDHVRVLRGVVAELNEASPIPVLFPDQTARRWVPTLSEEFQSASCHAGQYETSLMLACAPGTVRPIRETLPEVFVDLAAAIRRGDKTFEDAGAPRAYCGAPALASAQEGDEQFAALVEVVLSTVEDALGARR